MLRIASCLLLTLCVAAVRADEPVPIDQEPMHRLKFQNAHVRFFDVALPPGYRSLTHIHQFDGVFVNIEPSPTEAEDWGKPAVARSPRKPGETYFIGYAAKPKVHRISNVGTGVYHVTDTEILAGCDSAAAADDAPAGPVIVENKRVRVTRIELQPGATATLGGPCGMLVAVTGGTLQARSPGSTERIEFLPAGFQWREGSQPVVVENAGDEPFHAIDIVVR